VLARNSNPILAFESNQTQRCEFTARPFSFWDILFQAWFSYELRLSPVILHISPFSSSKIAIPSNTFTQDLLSLFIFMF
jgi:hypothetical protein